MFLNIVLFPPFCGHKHRKPNSQPQTTYGRQHGKMKGTDILFLMLVTANLTVKLRVRSVSFMGCCSNKEVVISGGVTECPTLLIHSHVSAGGNWGVTGGTRAAVMTAVGMIFCNTKCVMTDLTHPFSFRGVTWSSSLFRTCSTRKEQFYCFFYP
jgi:hypothetical protein